MESTRVPRDKCPYCGHEADTLTDPTGKHKPVPGSLTICLYCQNVGLVNEDLGVDKVPEDFIDTLPKETRDMIEKMQDKAFKITRPGERLNF